MRKSPKGRTPDVSLTAEAKVRKLRFERVPDTEIGFWGQSEREAESGTKRENLPEEVQRGVVYRDARVRLRAIAEITGAEQSSERDERRLGPGEPE